MGNSIENEIFKRIDDLQRQFSELKEKAEKNLDNSAMLYNYITKIDRKLIQMSVRVKKVIDRIDRILKALDKKKS